MNFLALAHSGEAFGPKEIWVSPSWVGMNIYALCFFLMVLMLPFFIIGIRKNGFLNNTNKILMSFIFNIIFSINSLTMIGFYVATLLFVSPPSPPFSAGVEYLPLNSPADFVPRLLEISFFVASPTIILFHSWKHLILTRKAHVSISA